MVRSTWCAFRWGFNKVESIRKSLKCHHLFLGSDSNFRVKQPNFAFLLFFLCTDVWPGMRKANSRHDMGTAGRQRDRFRCSPDNLKTRLSLAYFFWTCSNAINKI